MGSPDAHLGRLWCRSCLVNFALAGRTPVGCLRLTLKGALWYRPKRTATLQRYAVCSSHLVIQQVDAALTSLLQRKKILTFACHANVSF